MHFTFVNIIFGFVVIMSLPTLHKFMASTNSKICLIYLYHFLYLLTCDGVVIHLQISPWN